MPARFELQAKDMGRVVVSGRLSKEELEAVQAECEKYIQDSGCFKILVFLNHFQGWKKSRRWSDMSFAHRNDAGISKIAVVGDAKWHDLISAFTVEDFREVTFKYFTTDQQVLAQQWLEE